MKNIKGFTLVELVIVIVILGILSVVALPKYLSMTKEANIALLKGMSGAVKTGSELVYAKAILENKAQGEDELHVDNVTIKIYAGYPIAHWDFALRYIVNLDDVGYVVDNNAPCQKDWCGKGNQNSLPSGITVARPGRIAKFIPKGYSFNDECSVYYINRLDGSEPEIGLETDDC